MYLTRRKVSPREEKNYSPILNAQYSLMWMGLVTMVGENDLYSDALVDNGVKMLLPELLPNLSEDEWSEWVDNFKSFIGMCSLWPTLKFPFEMLMDLTRKNTVRVRFAAIYAIALEQDPNIWKSNLAQKTLRYLIPIIGEAEAEGYLLKFIHKTLKFYFVDVHLDQSAYQYLVTHENLIQKWFNWLVDKEMDVVTREKASIQENLDKANEELFIKRTKVEQDTIVDLVRTLCNPIYDDLLGRLYEQSHQAGGGEAELNAIRYDLQDMFTILSHFRIPITASEAEAYHPKWMVGDVLANPAEQDDNT